MKRTCRRIQHLLADAGPQALRDDATAQSHLESCDECFQALESLTELDQAFDELPRHDASDDLVALLLSRPELLTLPAMAPAASQFPTFAKAIAWIWTPRPRFVMGTALTAVVLIAVTFGMLERSRPAGRDGAGVALVGPESTVVAEDEVSPELLKQLQALGYVGGSAEKVSSPSESARGNKDDRAAARPPMARLRELKKAEQPMTPPPPPPAPRRAPAPALKAAAKEKAVAMEEEQLRDTDALERRRQADEVGQDQGAFGNRQGGRASMSGAEADAALFFESIDAPIPGQQIAGVITKSDTNVFFDSASFEEPAEWTAFLRERERVEGLSIQPADGYWANTYVPGDPALRLLAARLAERDRSAFAALTSTPPRLHDASRQPLQPFDPPSQAALAVYLHADRRTVTGESRLLLQVGLQGTPRYSGRRPAMNVGVVLDLRTAPSVENLAAMRTLVQALARARDLGDQFRLFVAGRPGAGDDAELLGPDDFRHGPLSLALQGLAEVPEAGPSVSLVDAVASAIAAVAATDDPTQPLGSSVVMVVTAEPLGNNTDALAGHAHRSAINGVPVSAVGVGTAVRLEELDRLALAGQGHRRLLESPAAAAALVDRELSAVARVIARAVRLRIHLAPGVRLVDVVGSRRLDALRAEEVRQAEKSIDQRLARNLGIMADRGEDEAGIQIVIPSFYAGDAHVVLLDVLVPGPGAVGDVTVRYKDLVGMENGVTRAHLSLARGDQERGALERNVLKNLLAHRLEKTLREAGDYLGFGNDEQARSRLTTIRGLLRGLRGGLPGLDQDRDIARDLAMLDEYLVLIEAGTGLGADDREHLSDSLRYAGRRKVLPPSEGAGGG